MTQFATRPNVDGAMLKRCAELHGQMHSTAISIYAARWCKENGVDLPESVQAYGEFPPINFGELIEKTAALDNEPVHGHRALMASAVSGVSLPATVIDSTVGMAVQSGFDSVGTVRQWTTLGRPHNYREEFRPIVEEVSPPKTHSRGDAAEHAEIRILHSEGVQLGRFSQQLEVDEMDELDIAPIIPAMAAALGRSAGSLVEDLGYSVLLNGTMDDGEPICHSDFGNFASGKPLTLENLGAAFGAMRAQKSDDKTALYANVRPDVLVVGSADFLNASAILKLLNEPSIRLIESERIDGGVRDENSNQTLAGSPGSWFLIDSRRAVERAFLDGDEKPTVGRYVNNGVNGRWSTTWTVTLSLAIKALDRRCVFRRDA